MKCLRSICLGISLLALCSCSFDAITSTEGKPGAAVAAGAPSHYGESKTKYYANPPEIYYLPKGSIHLDITFSKDTGTWAVVATGKIDPDYNRWYRLNRKGDSFSNDKFTVAIDPATQLLQTAQATTSDQSAQIAGQVAGLAANALTMGASSITAFIKGHPKALHYTFPAEPKTLTPTLTGDTGDTQFTITFKPVGPDLEDGGVATEHDDLEVPGVVVVWPQLWEVKVKGGGDEQNTYLLLPSKKTCFIPFKRRMFVQSDVTNVELKNGMVTSYATERASIVSAILGLPKTVLSPILPGFSSK